jgi:hypothetical protein
VLTDSTPNVDPATQAAAMMASPLFHTVVGANTSAKTRARPEPMNRPRMPKWAPLETVMFRVRPGSR